MARRGQNMLWNKRNNNINKNSQLRLQVYNWQIYIYITQQDAPHKDKILELRPVAVMILVHSTAQPRSLCSYH
jgi:hypothetical protein